MSIYATQWILKFPRYGDVHSNCEWVDVIGQGVPAHIGTPTDGYGYESGDPYAEFLPPAVEVTDDDDAGLRAIVIVRASTEKVGQEYIGPLLVLSGSEYLAISFQELHERICDALRGSRPKLFAEVFAGDGKRTLMLDDGSAQPGEEPGTRKHHQDVIPRIAVTDAEGLITFVKLVFGASGEYQPSRPTELRIGESVILISEAGARPVATSFLYVYVGDADETYLTALHAGAQPIEEPFNTPYGDRRGMIRDAWGNTWQIATRS